MKIIRISLLFRLKTFIFPIGLFQRKSTRPLSRHSILFALLLFLLPILPFAPSFLFIFLVAVFRLGLFRRLNQTQISLQRSILEGGFQLTVGIFLDEIFLFFSFFFPFFPPLSLFFELVFFAFFRIFFFCIFDLNASDLIFPCVIIIIIIYEKKAFKKFIRVYHFHFKIV